LQNIVLATRVSTTDYNMSPATHHARSLFYYAVLYVGCAIDAWKPWLSRSSTTQRFVSVVLTSTSTAKINKRLMQRRSPRVLEPFSNQKYWCLLFLLGKFSTNILLCPKHVRGSLCSVTCLHIQDRIGSGFQKRQICLFRTGSDQDFKIGRSALALTVPWVQAEWNNRSGNQCEVLSQPNQATRSRLKGHARRMPILRV